MNLEACKITLICLMCWVLGVFHFVNINIRMKVNPAGKLQVGEKYNGIKLSVTKFYTSSE